MKRLSVAVILFTVLLFYAVLGVGRAETDESLFFTVQPEKGNTITFTPQQAKFLRLTILSTNGSAPCLDELEVYGSGESTENLAQRAGVKPSATSCIDGYAIHKVEHLNDGKYGNQASWVAAGETPQSVQYEWPESLEIGKIVFSRDRQGRFRDRMPNNFEIFLSDDGENWRSVRLVYGVESDLSVGLTHYGASWLENVPTGGAIDLSIVPNRLTGEAISDYDRHLRDAFLAEENALLKVAGFADCQPWLLQRHYPEYVEPCHQPENILPLVTLAEAPETVSEKDSFWNSASAGSVRGFAAGHFAAGALVEQTVSAAVCDDKIYVKISGNRFLSDHFALVSTENVPTRGFVILQDGKPFWKQVDSLGGRPQGAILPLEGEFDSATLTLSAAIPLDYFPQWRTRGLYVGLGIGCRHTLAGGHPVHFKAADFFLRRANVSASDGGFIVTLGATGERSARVGDLTLEPNLPQELTRPASFGQVGPEELWQATDGDGNHWQLVLFDYDPSYRPLCQLADSLRRLEAPDSDRWDQRDYDKRLAIEGVANPRSIDIPAMLAAMNLPNEREELLAFLAETRRTQGESENALCAKIKKELIPLAEQYEKLETLRFAGNTDHTAQRNLFLKIRLLKRELFLSNEELSPAEHLLANKRHPFHPSHNYSDLFDSTWRPGGAVVKIDLPRIDGRLAPEMAVTTELVQAGDGVIRNPSASFDGTKIYYALRANPNDYFRIHELDLTTGETRRISADGPFHDFWPTELPDGGLAFISTRCKKKFICWRPQAFVLHRMNKDGGEITPLSFANLTEFAPSVMNDGRLLWTRSEYVDKGADYGHTLWTIRLDGTMPELVFGNTINLPQGYANGREVPETREVSCVMISHFGDLNGPVALLNLTKGPHDSAAIRSITPEVPWPGFWAQSETFREPFPISRDVILVAHAALDRFGLYLIDRFGNRELLTIDKEIDTICPQPFGSDETNGPSDTAAPAKTFPPRDLPPILRGVVKPDLAKKKMGQFSIANVYRGLEGQVEKGAAKYLRVCREMPTPLAQMPDGTYQWDHEPFMEYYASPVDILQGPFGWPSYVAKGVVGTVKIEEDGSADFLAPAEQVLFFQLLDENYNEIQRMRSVVQLQDGEQRSCIGCHESRLSTPEGSLTAASKNAGRTLTAPPWGAGPFWYERAVQPVLDKNCVSCHTAETAAEKPRQFDLTATLDGDKIPASYRSLVQSGDIHYFDYTWGAGKTTKAAPYSFGTPKSKLWEILRDENHKDVRLTPDEEQAIKCWTDLNVPLWGDYKFRRTR